MIMARSFDMNMMIRSSSLAGLHVTLSGAVAAGGLAPPERNAAALVLLPVLPMALQWTPPCVYFLLPLVVLSTWCLHAWPMDSEPFRLRFPPLITPSTERRHGDAVRRRVCQPAKLVRIKVLLLPTNKLACR